MSALPQTVDKTEGCDRCPILTYFVEKLFGLNASRSRVGAAHPLHEVLSSSRPHIMRFKAGVCGILMLGKHTYPTISGWFPDQFGHFPQVLDRGRKQQFIVSAADAAQPQSFKLQDAFEMGKGHLHFFPVTPGL